MWLIIKILLLLFAVLVIAVGIYLFIQLVKGFQSFDEKSDGMNIFKSN